jgi:hypothetical protein
MRSRPSYDIYSVWKYKYQSKTGFERVKREITCFNSFCEISDVRQNNQPIGGSWSSVDGLRANQKQVRERCCEVILIPRHTIFGAFFRGLGFQARCVESTRNTYEDARSALYRNTRSYFHRKILFFLWTARRLPIHCVHSTCVSRRSLDNNKIKTTTTTTNYYHTMLCSCTLQLCLLLIAVICLSDPWC